MKANLSPYYYILLLVVLMLTACSSNDEKTSADLDDLDVRKMQLNDNQGHAVWEPHLAVSDDGKSIAVATTYNDRLNYQYIWSGNNLDSWTGKSHVNNENGSAGDPVVQFGVGNTCYYTHLYNRDENSGTSIKLWRSSDGGKTYTHEVSVVEYPGTQDKIRKSPDKEWLAIDKASNTVYVAWTEFSIDYSQLEGANAGVVKLALCLSRSVDGGNTFSPFQIIDETEFNEQELDVHMLQLVVDKQSNVHLVWRDPATAQLVHSYSTNNGLTFSSKVPVAPVPDSSDGRTIPSLAVTESNQLVATWIAKGNEPYEYIEYAVCNNNTSWSTPKRVLSVPDVDQSCAAVASGSSGTYILCYEVADTEFNVVLYQSEDLTSFKKVHTFSKRSIGYTNFETDTKPEELLTGNTFRPGDYVGLATQGNIVWAAYTLPVTSAEILKGAVYVGQYKK